MPRVLWWTNEPFVIMFETRGEYLAALTEVVDTWGYHDNG